MPGKARRVASRQAQLSRRRRKQQRGGPVPQPAAQAPAIVDGAQAETVAEPPPAPAPGAAAPPPAAEARAAAAPAAAATQPAAAARRPAASRVERVAASNYVGPELRRILLLASVVLAVIIVLGILL